ncbi:phosphoserine phosphatase [Bacillus sp. FJAT-42376]|uniref:PP2C family serine/threonine-protein phosphatase n=1 Tax=Bacillus sp. FJAT-42376 TaxID=2014076 RepID=UPI000F50A58F|nr:PP2C family serine/threonine-protein phosphatase [Bacillus sp. FJAT-42376]AZB41390.1 phosphoserine phosphatase [Bacillus sp. FJAT-42376]
MIERETNDRIRALAFQQQKKGKVLCGDSFFMKTADDYFVCTLADGLGSGELAHESSQAISDIVEAYHEEDVNQLLIRCNQALKEKRGATVCIFKMTFADQRLAYGSVGNIRFVMYNPAGDFVYPLPVLGYMSGKPQKFKIGSYAYQTGAKFIVHSDGLKISAVKSLLRDHQSVENISEALEPYTLDRDDDLTYIVGQIF